MQLRSWAIQHTWARLGLVQRIYIAHHSPQFNHNNGLTVYRKCSTACLHCERLHERQFVACSAIRHRDVGMNPFGREHAFALGNSLIFLFFFCESCLSGISISVTDLHIGLWEPISPQKTGLYFQPKRNQQIIRHLSKEASTSNWLIVIIVSKTSSFENNRFEKVWKRFWSTFFSFPFVTFGRDNLPMQT